MGVDDLNLSVINCNFENNTALNGGAFFYFVSDGGNCSMIFSGCEFTGNTAQGGDTSDGGALAFQFR